MALSPVARNRLLAVAALAVAGLGLAFVAMGDLGKNLVYYWSPKELVEQGENAVGPTIRLGAGVKLYDFDLYDVKKLTSNLVGDAGLGFSAGSGPIALTTEDRWTGGYTLVSFEVQRTYYDATQKMICCAANVAIAR